MRKNLEKGGFSAAEVEFTHSLTHSLHALQTASDRFCFLQTESLVYKNVHDEVPNDRIYRENELSSNEISHPDNTADMRARTARARFISFFKISKIRQN